MDTTLFPWVPLCNRRGLEIFQHKFASVSTLLRVARWGLKIIKYIPICYKLHRLEEGL